MERMERRPEDYFENAFRQRQSIPLQEGAVETVDISPETQTEKPPIILAPAWGLSIDVYKPTIQEFVNAGRRTIALEHPKMTVSNTLAPEEATILEKYPRAEVLRATTFMEVVTAKHLEGAAMLGHSEGVASGILGTLVLARRARKENRPLPIKNLYLAGPAGLIGRDNIARLGIGFMSQGSALGKVFGRKVNSLNKIPVSDAERAQAQAEGRTIPAYEPVPFTTGDAEADKAAGKDFGEYVKSNLLRSAEEVWGLSRIQLVSTLRELKELGVGIIVMSGVEDPVFPTGKIASAITAQKKSKEEDITHIIDGFSSVRGEHALPSAYAQVIEGQISALERKQSKLSTADTSAG